MKKIHAAGASLLLASGLMLGLAGTASAAETDPTPTKPRISSGSADLLVDLFGLLVTGSSGSGSSFGITLGNDDVAATPSTGSSGTGSAAPLCLTNPTTPGCPK